MITAPEVRVKLRELRSRLRRARRSTKLTTLSGLALIALGILCLSLSGAVAHTGSWWQGTLDAFGVGFVVGGIVDVLVISVMSQISSGWRQRLYNEAEAILRSAPVEPSGVYDPELQGWMADQFRAQLAMQDAAADADRFLRRHGAEIDPELREQLRLLALKRIPPNPPPSPRSPPPQLR